MSYVNFLGSRCTNLSITTISWYMVYGTFQAQIIELQRYSEEHSVRARQTAEDNRSNDINACFKSSPHPLLREQNKPEQQEAEISSVIMQHAQR